MKSIELVFKDKNKHLFESIWISFINEVCFYPTRIVPMSIDNDIRSYILRKRK